MRVAGAATRDTQHHALTRNTTTLVVTARTTTGTTTVMKDATLTTGPKTIPGMATMATTQTTSKVMSSSLEKNKFVKFDSLFVSECLGRQAGAAGGGQA